MRFTVRTGVVTAGAMVALVLGSGVAQAEPNFQPNANDLVGVGSDTTMFVMHDLQIAYNATLSGTDPARLASWDAIPAGPIWIKDADNDGVQDANETINRPNGSSAGVNELRRDAACDGTSDSLANWARSSRARTAADSLCNGVAGGPQVLFLRFASDDLRYAVNNNNAAVADFPGDNLTPETNAPLDLTQAEVREIYTCTADGDSSDPDLWSDLRPGLAAQQIEPFAPQAGSGTRQSFLDALGITAYNTVCVDDTAQEHDAHPVDGNQNAIAPFSVGRFNTEVPADGAGQKPVQLNTAGFLFPRLLFNVVIDQTPADGAAQGGVPANLVPFFGDNQTTTAHTATNGWICTAAGDAVVTAAGFTPLSDSLCGRAS